jgi:hypothetical protein
MRIFTLIAISALSVAAAAPVLAQGMAKDSMMKDGMHAQPAMHMSSAEARQMRACKAMSHDRMMRNARCTRMMRMHPDMMGGDHMMQGGGMMKHN